MSPELERELADRHALSQETWDFSPYEEAGEWASALTYRMEEYERSEADPGGSYQCAPGGLVQHRRSAGAAGSGVRSVWVQPGPILDR